jgi:hypothetical protein
VSGGSNAPDAALRRSRALPGRPLGCGASVAEDHRGVFTARADPAGMDRAAPRRAGRVLLLQADWRDIQGCLADTETRMIAVLGGLGLTELATSSRHRLRRGHKVTPARGRTSDPSASRRWLTHRWRAYARHGGRLLEIGVRYRGLVAGSDRRTAGAVADQGGRPARPPNNAFRHVQFPQLRVGQKGCPGRRDGLLENLSGEGGPSPCRLGVRTQARRGPGGAP